MDGEHMGSMMRMAKRMMISWFCGTRIAARMQVNAQKQACEKSLLGRRHGDIKLGIFGGLRLNLGLCWR